MWNRPLAVRHLPPVATPYTFAVVRWTINAIAWALYGLAILVSAGALVLIVV